VESIATDGVSSPNFKPAETCAYRLLDSLGQDTLKRVIDQLPGRLMMVTKVKGARARVEFYLVKVCVQMWLLLLSPYGSFCQIHHNFMFSEDLCKLGKEDLDDLACKFYTFFR